MEHVIGIETVVAELVHHDFVGREIFAPVMEDGAEPVSGKQQGGLADLIAVRPILEMSDRADSQDEAFSSDAGSLVRTVVPDDFRQGLDGVLGFHAFSDELAGIPLETVGDNDVSGYVSVAPAGAEGYHDFVAAVPEVGCLMEPVVGIFKEGLGISSCKGSVMAERADQSGPAAHGLAVFHGEFTAVREPGEGIADRLRVVQGAEWIDAYIEAKGRHLCPYIVGKAAAEYHDSVFV